MRWTNWRIVVTGAGVALACASAAPYPGLRYGPECASARDQARSEPLPSSIVHPRPMELFIPPMPVPNNLRGKTALLEIRVDNLGRPEKGGVRVTGLQNSGYAKKLLTQTRRMRFVPAQLDGCAVEGRFRISISL